MKHLKKLIKDESGATAIEYGLIAALISIAIIVVVGDVGDSLFNTFTRINTDLTAANAGN
jgi:pilus assembly protein Flp/PilA